MCPQGPLACEKWKSLAPDQECTGSPANGERVSYALGAHGRHATQILRRHFKSVAQSSRLCIISARKGLIDSLQQSGFNLQQHVDRKPSIQLELLCTARTESATLVARNLGLVTATRSGEEARRWVQLIDWYCCTLHRVEMYIGTLRPEGMRPRNVFTPSKTGEAEPKGSFASCHVCRESTQDYVEKLVTS